MFYKIRSFLRQSQEIFFDILNTKMCIVFFLKFEYEKNAFSAKYLEKPLPID